MELTTTLDIDRPVATVFAYWAELERAKEWATPVIERRKITEGPVGKGTKYRGIDQYPGRQIEFTIDITEFVPNRRMAATWSEPIPGGWVAEFDESADGTMVTVHAHMNPTGALKLVAPIVGLWARRQMHQDLVTFRRRLEEGTQSLASGSW